ncbi:MAG: class I SAM-dependent methyltransferase [Chromatiaceae bacterium]|nr:class I SAM-dependent methyltransferase [Chromatiaceae bacterium]MCF8003393.1 class I SAM-dependent methyltransferase [Chromatiaceae bacterium]
MEDISSKEIFDNYLQNYERRGSGCFRSLEDVNEFHLDRLPRWIDRIPKDARILDAGCATGYLIGILHGLGYEKIHGVDLSAQLVQTARTNLPESISLHVEDIRDFLMQTPDGSYDVILFHHVLEHIPREYTIPLLNEFNRCLSDEGYLSLKTPNAACLLSGYHVHGDFTHIVQFNEFSLLQILEQTGFAADGVEFITHPPQLFWSWRQPMRAIFRLLNRLRWHLNHLLHWAVCVLLDLRPTLKVSEWELEALARK